MCDEAEIWKEASRGSRVYYRSYRASAFGPATSLCLDVGAGRCAVLSPVPDPDDEDFECAEALGTVAAFIVPNYGHRSGIAAWAARYPEAVVYAPLATSDLARRAGQDGFASLDTLTTDETIDFQEVPGARTGGTLLSVRRGARPVAYLDEVVVTMTQRPGAWLYRQLFRWKGIAPGVSVNRVYTDMMTTDRVEAARSALDLLEGNPVCLVAHGPPLLTASEVARARDRLRATR